MKRLHRFVFSTFFGSFIMTFFIVIFILLMQFLWKYIDDLAGKGLPIYVLGKLLFYVSASLVPMALPLAVLLASLMSMGNLGEHFELTAMKASGISLPRIVAPLAVLSIFISFLSFVFANYAVPYTNLKWKSLIYDISRQNPELQLKEGVFSSIDNYSIRVGKKNYKTNILYDVRIYDHSTGTGNKTVTVADSGIMKMTSDKKFLLITLFTGYNYSEVKHTNNQQNIPGQETYPFRRDKFERQELMIPLVGFGLNRTDESMFRQNYTMVSNSQLAIYTDSLETMVKNQHDGFISTYYASSMFRFEFAVSNSPARTATEKYQPFDSMFYKERPMDNASHILSALGKARDAKNLITNVAAFVDDTNRTTRKYKIEWWRKFTLAAACVIFFFIGAPLGAIIRKGGLGMPVVVSILFFVLYYVISISGEKSAKEGVIPPYLGMWISGIILLPLGAFLTYKATRESSMLNMEIYNNFFKKITSFFVKVKIVKENIK